MDEGQIEDTQTDTEIEPEIINASGVHTATIIFLHGLGDTGKGWFKPFEDIKDPSTKYVFPTAPIIPVTFNDGELMRSWFDIISFDPSIPEDAEGVKNATATVHALIEAEINNGIPSNKILLGGFSQGGALALYSALSYPDPLAGILGLSCWLPLHKELPENAFKHATVPVLLCHGDSDFLIPPQIGLATSNVLKTFMSSVTLYIYNGIGHSLSEEEMNDAKTFVESCLKS